VDAAKLCSAIILRMAHITGGGADDNALPRMLPDPPDGGK